MDIDYFKEKEKKYKEKCDKDIKEIILKDKIQKQLTKQLSALEKVTHTDALFKGKIDGNIKTMKDDLINIGYIGPINFGYLGNKDGKYYIEMAHLFSSIMSSCNASDNEITSVQGVNNGDVCKHVTRVHVTHENACADLNYITIFYNSFIAIYDME
ncbi:hypothetical protein PFBG_05886 [Plasmodium falciparum 7G8]|uniref:Rifin n=1 Tax=Plasmodium falciparum (isolate 7G8) TaxID=57266 RepID=W7FDF5_PLAF8|nr:hypothetical protein PFBG_05886 [Plasmodium falciparum 7G8]